MYVTAVFVLSDLMILVFGVLFGSSVLVMLVLILLIGAAILVIKRKSQSQIIGTVTAVNQVNVHYYKHNAGSVDNGNYVNSIGINDTESKQQKTQL